MMDDEFDAIPPACKHNKVEFCKLLIKSPKLQDFFIHFGERLKQIMLDEMKRNREAFELYMNHPRRPSQSHSVKSHINSPDREFWPKITAPLPKNIEKAIAGGIEKAQEKFNYRKYK